MKKLLSIFLTALMLLGCLTAFAGCGDKVDEVAEAALEEAVDYLENLYKNDAEKTPRDYDVAGKLKIGDLEYTVTWEVDVDEVTIKESETAGFYTVDVPDETAEEIPYVLTATIKDADGNTKEVTFSRKVPVLEKVVVEEDKKIVLSLVDTVDGEEVVKYVTGTHYLYTSSSSGNQKWELCLTTNKAEALAMTVKTNDDNTVSFVAEGKYLFCDANDVKFVDEQGDYTKYVIETATGGSFIKCAKAVYGTGESAKPQYLEMYSGYLTCYSMTTEEAKLNLFTFTMPEAGDAAGKISVPTDTTPDNGNDDGDDEGSNTTTAFVLNAVKPVAGTAYKLAFVQGKLNKAFYLNGEMAATYYLGSVETFADGLDYFVEEVTGGYNIYATIAGAKKYLNTVVNGTHVNGVYEDAASTVYTYDEELKTLVATIEGEKYVFGTKKDGTFTTLGPMKASTEPFYGVFVTEAATEEEVDAPETPADPTTVTPITTIAAMTEASGETKYLVQGIVTEVYQTTYGNMYIRDAAGNTITIYGSYDAEGNRYDAMTTKPQAGDFVKIVGIVTVYSGKGQIKDGTVVSIVSPSTVTEIAGMTEASTDMHLVKGEITEIYQTTYGNMYIKDADGNTVCIYGTFDEAGNRFDAMTTKPAVGDTIAVIGEVSVYQGKGQIKNGTIVVCDAPVAAPAGTTYTFSNYDAGTQYAENEEHVLDEKVKVTTNKAHFTSEIRLYDNETNDGTAVFTLASAVKSFAVNAGNKAATLNVYGSTDGTTWTLIQGIETTSTYTDYTVTIPDGTAYTYLKLDATGNQQIRVKSVTIEFVA